MKWQEENLDVLQNLEFAIVEVWRANPEMNDYSALRVYEAARQYYRAELRGQPPRPPALTGLDAVAFASLKRMCEFRLGRDSGPPPPAQRTPPRCRRCHWRNSSRACRNWGSPSSAIHAAADGRVTCNSLTAS